jgi:hypothetical protein
MELLSAMVSLLGCAYAKLRHRLSRAMMRSEGTTVRDSRGKSAGGNIGAFHDRRQGQLIRLRTIDWALACRAAKQPGIAAIDGEDTLASPGYLLDGTDDLLDPSCVIF